jgi:hypothetical protein
MWAVLLHRFFKSRAVLLLALSVAVASAGVSLPWIHASRTLPGKMEDAAGARGASCAAAAVCVCVCVCGDPAALPQVVCGCSTGCRL